MFKKVIELVSNGDYDGAYWVYTDLIRDLDTTSNILNQILGNQVEIYLHSLCANGEDDEYSVIKTINRNLRLLEILLKDPVDIEEAYEDYIDDELYYLNDALNGSMLYEPEIYTTELEEKLKLKREKLQVISDAIKDLKTLD